MKKPGQTPPGLSQVAAPKAQSSPTAPQQAHFFAAAGRMCERLEYQEELRRLQDLENQAVRWTKVAQLRAYVTEVEKKACSSARQPEEQARLANWLRWAREHVDRIDPLFGDAWKGPSMPNDS